MARRRPLRKKLTYRDNSGSSQLAHALHWRDFTWEAGPVIVAVQGPFGCMQVWAASEAEGRRVINHAAAIAEWDVINSPDVEWEVGQASGGRNGKTGTMRTKETPVGIEVTKRDGPSGPPLVP